VTDKPGGSATAHLDDNFAGDISDDDPDEPEDDDDDDNSPVLQEARALAGSDIIILNTQLITRLNTL
jgi:hypothetical protein